MKPVKKGMEGLIDYMNANISASPDKRNTSIPIKNGQITEWSIKKRLSSYDHEKLN